MLRLADQLWANTKTHLRFFGRNRLLLVLGILFAIVSGISFIPGLVMETPTNRFGVLRHVVSELQGVMLFIIPVMGLLVISSHLRGGSIRMVLTKPCPPAIWLASVYLASGIVAAVLHGLILVLPVGLSLYWGVPYQSGFAYVAIDNLFRTMIWFGYVSTLSVGLHPAVAAITALFLNESTFYQIKFLIATGIQAQPATSLPLQAIRALNDTIYYALPMVTPLSQRTEEIYASLRTMSGDWFTLSEIGAYAIVSLAFFHAAGTYLLARRSMA